MGGWKNKEEARQCVMCSEGEEESVEHVLMRCTAYRSEREQLWELMKQNVDWAKNGDGWKKRK